MRRRSESSAKATGRLKPLPLVSTFPLLCFGRQGVHREGNLKGLRRSTGRQSMGKSKDEPVGHRWARSSLRDEDEGILIHPPYQGDCGRHGTEEQRCDLRRTGRVPGWHRGKRTYKRKRSGEQRSVSSRPAEYYR